MSRIRISLFFTSFMHLLNLLYHTKNMTTYIKFRYCIAQHWKSFIKYSILNIISILTSSKYIDSIIHFFNYGIFHFSYNLFIDSYLFYFTSHHEFSNNYSNIWNCLKIKIKRYDIALEVYGNIAMLLNARTHERVDESQEANRGRVLLLGVLLLSRPFHNWAVCISVDGG